jgi:hypothetical protein
MENGSKNLWASLIGLKIKRKTSRFMGMHYTSSKSKVPCLCRKETGRNGSVQNEKEVGGGTSVVLMKPNNMLNL